MRHIVLPLTIPTTPGGPGESRAVTDLTEKWVQVTTTFAGSLAIEVSLDRGVTFFPVVTGITGPAIHPVPQPATHVRINAVTLTSGTPKAVIAGRDENG